ncbi:hypothetical protein JB92DRAFT_3084207 [Gautieria morchelliformis]|nr:hypothetical protein JB92DRAFT_3084207 [Gautieria morchelliformis]
MDIWCHDPVACVSELLANPFFREHMQFAPDKLFINDSKEEQIINKMWTAQWCLQKKLPPGVTIAAVILASDKTQNLLAGTRKDQAYRVFHYCMSYILKPLIEAGKEGVLMTCCLVASHQENSCPISEIAPTDCGELVLAPSHNPACTLKALKTCKLRLQGMEKPFWEDLPYTNIFQCFTPDILHQLHKGIFKDHLVNWCIQLADTEEVDCQFQSMPDHLCILTISQWTGHEHKEMEHVFASLIYMARAVIDFVYYASFPSHSTETL